MSWLHRVHELINALAKTYGRAEHSTGMQGFRLPSSTAAVLRMALMDHDTDETGRCACGLRLDPHNADARAEHLLEVAFAAGWQHLRELESTP